MFSLRLTILAVSEKAQLQAFASHRDPGWKIPLYQQVLDWLSGLTFLGVTLFLAMVAIRQVVLHFLASRTL